MSHLVLHLRSLFALLASLSRWGGRIKRLLIVWQHFKRCLRAWSRGLGGHTVRAEKPEARERGTTGLPGDQGLVWRGKGGSSDLSDSELKVTTICESRRPLPAVDLQLDASASHGQFLQPGDIPARPASMVIPSQSPVHSTNDLLHPYAYTHSNGSKTSISISVQSTSEPGNRRGRHGHLEVAYPRPDAGSTSRAAARGISRVASKAPSNSRATSRSRSRVRSHTPARSAVDLPNFPHSSLFPRNGSHHTLALPHGEVLQPSASIPSISSTRETIYPIMAIPRYDFYAKISPDGGNWSLAPVTIHFPIENIPLDWVACTHPEGRLYFYHPRRRIYTDCDVRDPQILNMLEKFASQIDEMVHEQELALPADRELVLFLEERRLSGGYNWVYYFVDHATRTLFWIQECNPIDELEITEITALKGPYDIKYELQAKYWQHIEMYPHGHEIPDDVYTELNGILVFASVDVNTSMTSTVTYRSDEVHRMLGLVKSAKSVGKTDYAVAAIGRLMYIWIHNRFLNFHGQTHARLGRDQSVYSNTKIRRTPLIKILAPLFWNAPEVHLRGLEKIWVDGIITIIPWSSFIGKLQNEWQEFVLYATVLLNANVAFLAIPSVDEGNDHVTAAQISSYLSIVTSVGSILLGLLLIRQHRVKSKDTADEANRFLNSRKHEMLGLETLAVIYSLPYALLIWGMVTFLLAFSFECFGTNDKVTAFTTAGAWIAVALLVGWTIITGWESGGESSVWDVPKRLWERMWPEREAGVEIDVVQPEADASASKDEKAKSERKWWARVFPRTAFPHSNDPPTTTGIPPYASNV